MKKGFVNFVEMIIVLLTLFLAFGIFFPGFSYKNRWTEALMKLKARDIMITADRTGIFHPCIFSSTCFKDNFLDFIIPTNRTNIIPWSEVEGTVKNQISISCNCSTQNISYLYSAFNGLRINDRTVSAKICYTDLEVGVNPCMQSSDTLVIWGYKDFSAAKYKNVLQQYLQSGSVIQVADFPSGFTADSTQQQVFGIAGSSASPLGYDSFVKPGTANQVTYQPWKFFFHSPLQLTAGTTGLPTGDCAQNMTGNFTIRAKVYPFSVCNGVAVYFDTDGDGGIDRQVSGQFNLSSAGEILNFTLRYVSPQSIGIKFGEQYRFLEFSKTPSTSAIVPSDGNSDRILLKTDVNTGVVIVNGTRKAKTAWMADFSRDLTKMGDDHRQLLTSLILSLSNKDAFSVISPNVKIGFVTSYINVNASDIYEVFRFNLGLGYPY